MYWFNHISTSTQNAHPNTWSIRYNPLTQQTTAIGPSFAIQSLLYSLLGGNAENIMLFSRPAAWSDIYMSKKVHTSGNADIIIDSLILNLQYDFTPRPTNIRNIDITTSDGLLPYIACSEADRNGRSNGKGSFHRSYTRNNGTITFAAMETHGNYHFVNWTNRLGNVVSENTALTVNKMTDQFYRANYELWIPVINVADTIFVGSGSGEYMVQIQNIGQGDIEMDWYVSDSLSTWVHIDGIAEGIDDGYFTFTYEPMRTQDRRIDSLEILAPEIAGMSKMIYIVQDPSLLGVSVSINPVGAGTVVGTGFFAEGDICTLIATANEGYTFINWTKNGEEVSTDTTYSFTVTENATFVANFEANTITQTIQLSAGWNWISSYVGISLNDLQASLVTALPGTNAIAIKSKDNGMVTYNGSTWRGQLNALDLTQMYRISVPNACEISLEGMPINPAEHPITIQNGFNWIAFPFSESMTVNDAFAGFAVSGDMVKSKDNGTATYNGSVWRGSLNTLVPGQGYIYKSNVQGNRTFTFPTGAK